MTRRVKLPSSRRHIFVYDEDWEFLSTNFGINSPSRLGQGPACREIIHSRVQFLRAKQNAAIDESSTVKEESVA